MDQNSGNTILINSGRSALWLILKTLKDSRKKTILVPDYICAVVIDTIEECGFHCRKYPLTSEFIPDLIFLNAIFNLDVAAIIFVNYFGIKLNIEAAIETAKNNKWLAIEDNAHGFGIQYDTGIVSERCDFYFSCPHKTMDRRLGATLWSSQTWDHQIKKTASSMPKAPVVDAISDVKKILSGVFRNEWILKNIKPRPNYCDPYRLDRKIESHYRIDEMRFKSVINKYNIYKYRLERQKIYQLWRASLEPLGLKSIFQEISSDSCPWCYVAICSSDRLRKKWFDLGWNSQINIFSWPNLRYEVANRSGHGLNTWSRVICFEINPDWGVSAREKIKKISSLFEH